MPDYLDQLASRFQQPELVVQPRLMSRFESPRHTTLAAPESFVLEERDNLALPNVDVMPTATSIALPAPQMHDQNRQAAENMHALSTAQQVWASHQPSPGRVASGSLVEPPTMSAAATSQLAPGAMYPAWRGQADEPRARITPSVVEQQPAGVDRPEVQADTVVPKPSGHPEYVERSTTGQDVRKPIQPLERSEKAEHPWRPPILTHAPLDSTAKIEREFLEAESLLGHQAAFMPKPEVAPLSEQSTAQSFTAPTAPPRRAERVADSPTIQVTIGRIEIRATVEATPTRKPLAKAPVMSLDEYLRQRNGGRG